MKHSISVITRLQDNGDGGYTLYAYNSEEELIADHPKSRGGQLSETEIKEILSGEDEYENGYIGSDTIKIEVIDGVARLDNPLRFHAGQ